MDRTPRCCLATSFLLALSMRWAESATSVPAGLQISSSSESPSTLTRVYQRPPQHLNSSVPSLTSEPPKLAPATKAAPPNSPSGPIVVPYSQYWEGSDGQWSSFVLQLGERVTQTIRVFPSTSLYQTWAVAPEGCPANLSQTLNCPELRGGLYNSSASLSWVATTIYKTDNVQFVGAYYKDVVARQGFETVSFGYPSTSNPEVKHSVVGMYSHLYFSQLGLLGLDPKPTNWSDMSGMLSPQPSLMELLVRDKKIQARGFGYAAGAYHRSAYGNLVLGGYDKALFKDSKTRFPFWQDVETPLKAYLKQITVATDENAGPGTVSVLDQTANPLPTRIDSTQSFLYLPSGICDQIAKAFGLKWDPLSRYYLINSTIDARLKAREAYMSFNLASSQSWGTNVTIKVPYAALSHKLTWPLMDDPTPYFPILPASSPDQYMLGRAFLQEAYLVANYERKEFSLHPMIWPQPENSQVVSLPTGPGTSTSEPTPTGLGKGAMVGVIITSIVVFLALLSVVLWLVRRRRQKQQKKIPTPPPSPPRSPTPDPDLEAKSPSSPTSPTSKIMELDSAVVHESDSTPLSPRQELAAFSSPITSRASPIAEHAWYKEVETTAGHRGVELYFELDADQAPGTLGSNATTLVNSPPSTVNGLLSPIPQTPAEYYARPPRARWPPRDPASPIPQTPAEYYGREKMGDRLAVQQQAGDLSPIPVTPLEFYGPFSRGGWSGTPVGVGLEQKAEGKGEKGSKTWVGRAPGLPNVVLTPATPVTGKGEKKGSEIDSVNEKVEKAEADNDKKEKKGGTREATA
ncbi:acid protease [Trichodelitschia bisporula]|uniref:Acid protease n=1 Tax=Trichodelitschia bisporula TaxID=703511 RepID=A0A6G1HSB3_9PEZI|nr:acid protease [Trichodelitschia bisporula]